jgi:hypothetical protein
MSFPALQLAGLAVSVGVEWQAAKATNPNTNITFIATSFAEILCASASVRRGAVENIGCNLLRSRDSGVSSHSRCARVGQLLQNVSV